MNKKLLTAAIGAALIAGPMAASANPTVFGGLHISVDRVKTNSATTSTENDFISSNFSRLGVKGEDSLGGGMKSVYQILAPLAADTGASGLGGTLYDTFLGLSGPFGTARLGRIDSPVKDLSAMFNQFGTRVGDSRNVTGLGGSANFDNRFNNVVRYDSPKFGGVTIAALYSSDEESGSSDAKSINVRWSGGPVNVGFGYEAHDTTGAANKNETILRLVGNVKIGMATIYALAETMSDLGGVANADRDSFGLGGALRFGNTTVKAQYVQTDKVKNSASDNGGKLFAIGADHALSKNTTAYAVYGKVDNKTSATFKVSGAGAHGNSVAANAGQDQSALSAGLIVNF